jgi:nucleoside-diphosphate-sugar epimerase
VRILMTGCSGFIGRIVAERLASRHVVFATVRTGSMAPDCVLPVVWDLATPAPFDRLPPAIDAVLHMAQSRRYREFPEGATDAFAVNVAATAALLTYAWRAGASGFVLVSSGTVYEPYSGAIVENAPLAPTSSNGATKLAAECLAFAYQSVFSVCALRLFFPYGPGQVARLIPEVIGRVQQGKAVRLAGHDGLRMMPIFVSDVADVMATAVTEQWSGRVNLAGTRLVSLRELTAMIASMTGNRAHFKQTNGDAPVIAPDLAQLRSLYDTRRFLPLDDGLRRTISWR